jgi:hypothetical protein
MPNRLSSQQHPPSQAVHVRYNLLAKRMRQAKSIAVKLARMVKYQNTMTSPEFKSEAELPHNHKRKRKRSLLESVTVNL